MHWFWLCYRPKTYWRDLVFHCQNAKLHDKFWYMINSDISIFENLQTPINCIWSCEYTETLYEVLPPVILLVYSRNLEVHLSSICLGLTGLRVWAGITSNGIQSLAVYLRVLELIDKRGGHLWKRCPDRHRWLHWSQQGYCLMAQLWHYSPALPHDTLDELALMQNMRRCEPMKLAHSSPAF